MNKFLALVKRDLAENRGALVITPMVISALLLIILVTSAIFGKLNFDTHDGANFSFNNEANFKGSFDIDGEKFRVYKENGVFYKDNGVTKTPLNETGNFNSIDAQAFSAMAAIATSVSSALPILVAMFAIVFALIGALYDERKERNIMFWKSLPVSDLQTVATKVASIGVGGLGIAVISGFILHILTIAILLIALNFTPIPLFVNGSINFATLIGTTMSLWAAIIISLIAYLLWALPIYGWLLTCSAFAPKSPFFWAILPIALLPLFVKIFADDYVSQALIPMQHLSGEQAFKYFAIAFNNSMTQAGENVHQHLTNIDIAIIFTQFKDPQLWIGVVIGGALIYAASEIRKRKSL